LCHFTFMIIVRFLHKFFHYSLELFVLTLTEQSTTFFNYIVYRRDRFNHFYLVVVSYYKDDSSSIFFLTFRTIELFYISEYIDLTLLLLIN